MVVKGITHRERHEDRPDLVSTGTFFKPDPNVRESEMAVHTTEKDERSRGRNLERLHKHRERIGVHITELQKSGRSKLYQSGMKTDTTLPSSSSLCIHTTSVRPPTCHTKPMELEAKWLWCSRACR